jgi:hypothetical protein
MFNKRVSISMTNSNKVTLTLLTVLLLFILKLNAQVSLPYTTGFESHEGFVNEVPLSGDWKSTDDLIVTTKDVAQSGTQSVRIISANPENIISLRFDSSGSTILFVDYYIQLTASALPVLPSFTDPETNAIIAV